MDWDSTPNDRRHAKPVEVTLTEEERAFLERFGGGAGKAGRDKSAVVGAALMALQRLTGDEIVREIAAAKERRRNRT